MQGRSRASVRALLFADEVECCGTKGVRCNRLVIMSDGQETKQLNALAEAASAYLRSAMHQPVEWHEWSEEVFAQAKAEDKPVLLDIGAVWCHWCHVMDRESYENAETAKIINQPFGLYRFKMIQPEIVFNEQNFFHFGIDLIPAQSSIRNGLFDFFNTAGNIAR